MAFTTEHKIYVALALLAALGGGVWYVQQQEKKEEARYTAGAASTSLPDIKLSSDDAERITKLEIKNPEKGDVVLEKEGDTWRVKQPVDALANQQNVKSVLENLKELKAKDVIDKSAASYAEYNLDDAKAIHVTAFKGADKSLDLYFGKSGGRGQMTRVGGTDGIYAISGYSAFVYGREVKNWRDTSILKFDDANAVRIDIKNANGELSFKKDGETWTGSNGKTAIARFDDSKLKDLLRVYKSLNADDFGDGKSDADTGLDKPEATMTIALKDGETLKLDLGKAAAGESRYFRKEGAPQVYVISSWASAWATANAEKFQKPEEKKDEKK